MAEALLRSLLFLWNAKPCSTYARFRASTSGIVGRLGVGGRGTSSEGEFVDD